MSQIKAIITIFNSKRDRAGNCYWAFRYTDVDSGIQTEARITGTDNNILVAMRRLVGSAVNYHPVYDELPIRLFEAKTRPWPYAGCTPEEIAGFITDRVYAPDRLKVQP